MYPPQLASIAFTMIFRFYETWEKEGIIKALRV